MKIKKKETFNYEKHLDNFGHDYFHGGTLSNYGEYDWQHFSGVLKEYTNTFLEYFPQDFHFKVLDAGGAKGFLVKILLDMDFDAYGFDISKFAVEDGIKTFPELKERFRVDDITKFTNYMDSSFDLVLACEVLEHIPEHLTESAIRNIARVTKKYALFSLPMGDKKGEGDGDVTHINIHPREWWENKIFPYFKYVPDIDISTLNHVHGLWNFMPLILKQPLSRNQDNEKS